MDSTIILEGYMVFRSLMSLESMRSHAQRQQLEADNTKQMKSVKALMVMYAYSIAEKLRFS